MRYSYVQNVAHGYLMVMVMTNYKKNKIKIKKEKYRLLYV